MATNINVQFTDATQETIISYFGSPQDPDSYENLGTVSTSDPRWATYYATIPENMQAFFPAPTTD